MKIIKFIISSIIALLILRFIILDECYFYYVLTYECQNKILMNIMVFLLFILLIVFTNINMEVSIWHKIKK